MLSDLKVYPFSFIISLLFYVRLPQLFGIMQGLWFGLDSTLMESCQAACSPDLTHLLLGPHDKGFLFCHVVPVPPHRQHALTERATPLPQAI